MKRAYTTVAIYATVLFSLIYLADANAQAVVRDSSPVFSGADTPVASSPATSSPTTSSPAIPAPPVAELHNRSYNSADQIQQLQQEILDLRGLVEEQGFEIKRLKQQRLDDYLDLDKRITELGSRASDNPNQAGANPEQPIVSNNANAGTNTNEVNSAQTEKTLYRDGINKLLNKQDYQGAKSSFNKYLADYPQGIYTPNVYYWQGQIYLSESDQPAAEELFKALVDNYPSHQKNPDAKYKLATIYFEQGKKKEAKQLLDGVAASNTDASRLAKAFLASQYN